MRQTLYNGILYNLYNLYNFLHLLKYQLALSNTNVFPIVKRLDKLFNLEVINILNSILKDINKNNKVRLASLDSEIRTLDESIDSIKRSIEKAIEREKEEAR